MNKWLRQFGRLSHDLKQNKNGLCKLEYDTQIWDNYDEGSA